MIDDDHGDLRAGRQHRILLHCSSSTMCRFPDSAVQLCCMVAAASSRQGNRTGGAAALNAVDAQ
ncbi:MAG TPA: hypothetical protein VMB82_06705 [Acidimicrobiales bacterium]|nr:hypothetical protein [Acidimicrobiales bacterium]